MEKILGKPWETHRKNGWFTDLPSGFIKRGVPENPRFRFKWRFRSLGKSPIVQHGACSIHCHGADNTGGYPCWNSLGAGVQFNHPPLYTGFLVIQLWRIPPPQLSVNHPETDLKHENLGRCHLHDSTWQKKPENSLTNLVVYVNSLRTGKSALKLWFFSTKHSDFP